MKRIDLIVSTRNRLEKLLRMLDSIPKRPVGETYINVKIACDGDSDKYLKKHSEYDTILISTHRGSVFCRNVLSSTVNDGLLYATDDIVFDPGSIEAAFDMFNDTFRDDDGVVGLVQNKSFHPTGVAMVGQKFLQRYPDRQLFRPSLWHFAASEVYDHAMKMGKFIQCTSARVTHFHPCFDKEEMDQTHLDARIYKQEDMEIISKKKNAGLIWGYNDFTP